MYHVILGHHPKIHLLRCGLYSMTMMSALLYTVADDDPWGADVYPVNLPAQLQRVDYRSSDPAYNIWTRHV